MMRTDAKFRPNQSDDIKSRFRHICELPEDHNQPPKHSPYDSCGDRFWNLWRRCIIPDRHNIESKIYYRSFASLQREKDRQLGNPGYKFIIHPFSNINIRKEMCNCFMWIFLLFSEPFMGSFGGIHYFEKYTIIAHLIIVVNVLLAWDVLFRFFIGYSIENVRMVILEPKLIRKRYLLGFFIFDIVPIVTYLLYYVLPVDSKSLFYLYQCQYMRVMRLKTIYENFDRFLRHHKIPEYTRTIILSVGGVMLLLHIFSCVLGTLNLWRAIVDYDIKTTWLFQYYEERALNKKQVNIVEKNFNIKSVDNLKDSIDIYFVHLSIVVSHFFGCGHFRFRVRSRTERLTLSIVLLTGMAFHIYVVARVLQIFSMLQISEMKYEQMAFQFEDYMMRKDFPMEMKKRIRRYLDYKFNKKFFLEDQILDSLSEHIRMEVLLYSCGNLINQVKMFRGLSKSAMGCILALLQHEIFLKNDVIMNAGEDDDSIYFILYGTCAIVLPSGKELSHVEDGMHFGNTSGYADNATVHFLYSVVPLEVAEVFHLSKMDIRYCMSAHPELIYKLESMAQQKAKDYNTLFAIRQREEQITDEILDQLRAKKILRRGLKRSEFYGR